MANATDFIATVYDTIAKVLNVNNLSSGTFFQMAWPGISISPIDFQVNGKYDILKAEETTSTAYANFVPTFNKFSYELSGYEMDDLYQMILMSARPSGVVSADIPANPLYKLFSDALYEFTTSTRPSNESSDPSMNYHLCRATPSNWYDETVIPFWSTINISSNEIKPADSKSIFVQKGGLNLINKQGMWKLNPKVVNNIDLKNQLQQKYQTINTKLIQKNPVTISVATPNTLNTNIIKAINLTQGGRSMPPTITPGFDLTGVNKEIILKNTFKDNFFRVRYENIALKLDPPINVYQKYSTILTNLQPAQLNKEKLIVIPGVLPARKALILNDLLIKDLPTKPASPQTDGFNVSFKFLKVNLDRNWLKLALLSNPNWYIAETNANYYSNGSVDNNPGIFSLLPMSFIVISNLRITANWSAEDKDSIKNSVSFGPFDIRNGTFNQNTLEIKGMQIIAYISKVMPPLAPKQV